MTLKNRNQKSAQRARDALSVVSPFIYLGVLNLLPHFYTPPALTQQKRATYSKVIKFITGIKKKHNLEDAMLDHYDTVDVFRNNRWMDRNEVLTHIELQQALKLCSELDAVHCRFSRSEGNMIMFYPIVSYFLPHPPGVLYSTDTKDPNHAGGPRVARLRPFKKLEGNWFSSMNMRPMRFSGW